MSPHEIFDAWFGPVVAGILAVGSYLAIARNDPRHVPLLRIPAHLAGTVAAWRRHRVAWYTGEDLTAGIAAMAAQERAVAESRCGRCRGRRCWYNRNGLDCPAPRAPRLTQTLSGVGRHQPHRVIAGWVPPDWSPLPLYLRVGLAPRHWARRLPVPVSTVGGLR